VKDSVPVEFELQRARDLVDQIVPELQANVRLIAQEEVEIAALEKEIQLAKENVTGQRAELVALRSNLESGGTTFQVGHRVMNRDQITERLAHRFARLKDAEMNCTGKERLLESRRKSLEAAQVMFDRAREQKIQLEQKIETLVAQHRLLQSSESAAALQLDGRQLTKAERLLTDIQKRLDVAQRVLAHEAEFSDVESPVAWNEEELLAEIDDHLGCGADQSVIQVAKHPRD
jgi:hypothetical protein